jgi:hypothetical protein
LAGLDARSFDVRRLRWAIVLPLVQFVVAAIIQLSPSWSPWRDICSGMNAPALLFRAVPLILAEWRPESPWLSWSILGVYVSDFFFMLGVIVVWLLVGRALDQGRTSRTSRSRGFAAALIVHPLLLVLGGFLSYVGFYLDDLVRTLLTWLWSVSLIFVSVRGLVAAIRHREPTQREGGDGV